MENDNEIVVQEQPVEEVQQTTGLNEFFQVGLYRIIAVVVAVILALVSFFPASAYFSSPENHLDEIQALDSKAENFAALKRIQNLLEMLRWREGDVAWLEQTRYMEIEQEVDGDETINEYVERPVLPTPLVVAGREKASSPQRGQTAKPRQLQDLEPGMIIRGQVKRVVEYGAFVDIGVGTDGLIHISKLKEGWVDRVQDIVSVGGTVHVKVLSVDLKRKRINLSMKDVTQHN